MTAPVSGPIDLSGQTAGVTGAAGGIGAATCEALARHGADVVATDVAEDHLDAVVEAVEGHGQSCETVACDVSDPEDVRALRDAAFAFADTVEIVVNVAGVVHRNPFSEMTLEQWNRVIGINLTGTFLVSQAFYDHMVERGYGKVVCVSSVSARVGGVISDAGYASSKAGVNGLVRWLGKNAAADGVYVNAVAPGPIVTPMTEDEDYRPDMVPLDRLGEPEDVAEGVLYLASDMSNYVTGTVLDVNGGMRMD